MGRVWGHRAWGSDEQGVQVRWAGGSGQMGRGFRSVRQGLGWVRGLSPGPRGGEIFDPSYISSLSPWTPVTSFTKEVNPRLAKRPLNTNGRLANRWLTYSVKEATGVHPLCPSPHCLQLTCTGLKNCFNQIHFQIDLNVFIDNITTHIWSSWHYHDMYQPLFL